MGKTRLSLEQLKDNFADLHPNYSRDEATVEAARCLYCYDAPCTRACPTQIDVPRFIRQILHQNVAGAAQTILEANVLGGSCARACPTEVLCEGACVDRVRAGAPVQIGRLQRYATDYAMEQGIRFFQPGSATGHKVAIVGAGPAGLACCHELRLLGHEVTLFEAQDVVGGLNTLGIAAYKITREFSLAEIQPILDLGVDMRLNTCVDHRLLKKLLSDYDAVFIAIGLGSAQRLNIPGAQTQGVWEALDFIQQMHRPESWTECHVGNRVVVIGCGNTAIDAATAAIRLGAANVTICYRRGLLDASAYAYEVELAKADGVAFEWYIQPAEFLSTDGKLTGIRFNRTQTFSQLDSAEEQYVVSCDMAIMALGQSTSAELLSELDATVVKQGRIHVDPGSYKTRIPKLFAGGDCISGGAEIVNAVQEGKLAAREIHLSISRVGESVGGEAEKMKLR